MAEASTRLFVFAHLRAGGGGWAALSDRLPALLAPWNEARCVGVFMGLFGLRNHDLFVLLSLPDPAGALAGAAHTPSPVDRLRATLPPDIELLDSLPMKSTVRPADDAPLRRAGVYVFRFFDVAANDVDEVVSLSDTAWLSFERGDGYSSEPVGLFRFADPQDARGRMLLLTWYDNLTSWERSRTPHPDATANFRRRAALSRSVIAYATRLAETMPR